MSEVAGGGAEVVQGDQTLMTVPPAVALGADGRPVPVSYSVSGDTLTTHVDLSGPVDFPVIVDPLFVGNYGVANGANVWGAWNHEDTCNGCFSTLIYNNLIQTGTNPGTPSGSFGYWQVKAPGSGGAGIARVDLSGVIHEATGQSNLYAGISGAGIGPNPVYSWNGYTGASGASPLEDPYSLSGVPIAFCAQNAGGNDTGVPNPLCNEEYSGSTFFIGDIAGGGMTVFNYIRVSGATITYLDNGNPSVEFHSNGKEGWNQHGSTAATISATDSGLGIHHFGLEMPVGAGEGFHEDIGCETNGFSGCPTSMTSEPINLSLLATGIYEVGAIAADAAGNAQLQGGGTPPHYPKLYIDNTPPTLEEFTGSLAEAANSTIGNGNFTLHFGATDGSESVGHQQSGVESLEVQVDARSAYTTRTTCPEPKAIPASGCYSLSGEWTMNGQSFGAGVHKVTVIAKDWAGNTESRSLYVTVNEAENQPVGPGSVGLETGDYKLTATDVSQAAANATLSLRRSFDSRSPEQGASGPLGPQWALSVPDGASMGWQSLTPLPEGAVSVYTPSGEQLIFSPKTGGGWESPAGYQTDTLTEPSTSPAIYQITDASGNATKFTQPAEKASIFVPSKVEQSVGAGGLNRVSYSFTKTEAGITEPTKILAPEPSEGACATTLVKGCRALTFKYATSTTATGENKSEWGDYQGRLSQVYFHAWDRTKGEMTEPVVAQYSYDKAGRLRAEWDPRVSPALKTIYGYDSAGRVTALTPPGHETTAFHYGAIAADANEGRLLSVAQPSASAELWNGLRPTNTTVPALSGSAKQGVKMTVNNGVWSNSPVAYGYQWLRCSANGDLCSPILGATNPSYTLVAGDVGHTLVVQVAATNGGGSIVAATAPSAKVTTGTGTEGAAPPAPGPRSTIEYRLPLSGAGLPELTATKVASWGQSDVPTEATAIFPPDEVQSWPATDYKRASIYYLDSRNHTVNVASPTGGITTTEYDNHNNIVRSLSADNRATAVAAGTKSLETSQALDTQSKYNEEGTELQSTLGPEHTVKLASGSEVAARKRTVYSYDEGAPSSGGPYRLVTKTTEGAKLSNGEEKDLRTVKNSYSGQENLGWKLHAPTSSTADPSGVDLVHKTAYDPATGSVREDTSPAGNSESIYPPAFASTFGSGEGTGNGQFKVAAGTATDASGNVWVVDKNNGRIEKFSSTGTFIATYGSKGAGNGQFNTPWGIAINQSTGNVYVADAGNNRIEELSSAGAFITTFGTTGSGTLKEPIGVAVESEGNVWTTDWAHNRAVKFTAGGTYIREVGSFGTGNAQFNGPGGIATSEGSVFVVDSGNDRVEQFNNVGEYQGQFGSKGSTSGKLESPTGIAANPSTGNLYVADTYNYRVQEFSPAGRFLTEWGTWGASHAFNYPDGIAINATGKIYVSDQEADKITSWTPPEAGTAKVTFASQFGSGGSGNGQFNTPIASAIDGAGNIWITDWGNNRVQKFSPSGSFIASYGSFGSGNGQFSGPGGIDVNQSASNVYIADGGNARIEELSTTGTFVRSFGTTGSGKLTRPGGLKVDSAGNVWVADMTADRVVEFSSTGTFIAAYGSEGSGNLQFKTPVAVTSSGENIYVTDAGNRRVQEMTNKGVFVRQWGGGEGEGSGEFYAPEGIAADGASNLYVVDNGAGHVEEFSSTGAYKATFATKGSEQGQLSQPAGDSIDAAGNMLVVDTSNSRVQKWTAVNQAVHNTRTIYYSSAANSEFSGCGAHAEWAGLPCLVRPYQQPQGRGLPNLSEPTYTYNVWDEPATTTDTVGSTTRTATIGYDSSGRVLTRAISSSVGTAVPTTTNKYSETTGALLEESTSTKAIKFKYNNLGQLESYTDADGNASTYTYDVDSRTEKASDGKGTQTYGYDTTSGLLTSLKDSAAGNFTGSYDAEGSLTTEGYPNGMNANYAFDPTGQPTSLEYVKTTHCSSGCTWYSDHVTPSIHNQWLSQTSSLTKEAYAYDGVGRLSEVQETPVGKGCTTRLYALDEDGNRTSLTTRGPGSEGQCTTEGGLIARHLYDEGDRLAEEGVSYDAFGNTTALPAQDAGGAALTSSFYANNLLAGQKQSGQSISYGLDPADRTRETALTGTINETVTSHYSEAGDSPAWTVNGAGSWTRYIAGIVGLAAIQNNGGTPELQLENLHGDIVAKAALSETETKLLGSAETTEFGVPTISNPAKYSWLGGEQRATELPTGMVAMGARGYVPQLGRFEQSDPRPGGSADAYAYTSGDPVNSSDASGEWTVTTTSNYELFGPGVGEARSEDFIEPGAIMPPPVNLQIEQESNAHPPWEASSADLSGGGSGGTPRRFRNLETPGLPPGALCEGAVSSKKYKKEHPKLCHEIEHSNPWEPAEAACDIAAFTPWGGPCRILIPIQVSKKVHH